STSPTKGKNKRSSSAMSHATTHRSTLRIVDRTTHRQPFPLDERTTLPPPDPSTTDFPPTPFPPGTPGTHFNIYKALLRHPNLFFPFALRLPPHTLLSLYAIDKEFHYRLNRYSISIMHDYVSRLAPTAARIFAWRLYPHLCISDPVLKPMDARPHLARDIPSLRWVSMVLYRGRVVRQVLTLLGIEGHRVPARAEEALMRFWVLMDLGTFGARRRYLREGWGKVDVLLVQMFFVKVDMRMGHPVTGGAEGGWLGHLLLTQKSLVTLRDVLMGSELRCDEYCDRPYDELMEWVVQTYPVNRFDLDWVPDLVDEESTGIPSEYVGFLCREHRLFDGSYLPSAVDLVEAEGLKRFGYARTAQMDWRTLEFILYGHVDAAGENVPVARRHVKSKKV
ncbi:hypothetical protein EJ04DRAFT_418177, partial [Polyplosphaeria fusca]